MSRPPFEQYRGQPSPKDAKNGLHPYLASATLATAVNTALAVGQPLLLTGEAGTGKTTLADSVAAELRRPILKFHTRSDSVGRELLYHYDHLRRFYDAQVRRNTDEELPLANYRRFGRLGEAVLADEPTIVLIDEIDKAPPDFANDLLNALDRFEIDYPETDEKPTRAKHRPFVLITSNRESRLSQAFLRRVVYHHIEFPSDDQLKTILALHHRPDPGTDAGGSSGTAFSDLADAAIGRFLELRRAHEDRWEKKPTIGELLVWVQALRARGTVAADLRAKDFTFGAHPLLGALVKTSADLAMVRGTG